MSPTASVSTWPAVVSAIVSVVTRCCAGAATARASATSNPGARARCIAQSLPFVRAQAMDRPKPSDGAYTRGHPELHARPAGGRGHFDKKSLRPAATRCAAVASWSRSCNRCRLVGRAGPRPEKLLENRSCPRSVGLSCRRPAVYFHGSTPRSLQLRLCHHEEAASASVLPAHGPCLRAVLVLDRQPRLERHHAGVGMGL